MPCAPDPQDCCLLPSQRGGRNAALLPSGVTFSKPKEVLPFILCRFWLRPSSYPPASGFPVYRGVIDSAEHALGKEGGNPNLLKVTCLGSICVCVREKGTPPVSSNRCCSLGDPALRDPRAEETMDWFGYYGGPCRSRRRSWSLRPGGGAAPGPASNGWL